MNLPYIINIQKYAIHDGDGIRTTIFFKGCPLACNWCHNPESQFFLPEIMHNQEKCTNCGICAKICVNQAICIEENNELITTIREKCNLCGECGELCINEARKIVGKQYSIKELCKEIAKDNIFYENSNGGVTLSGGEVLAQDMDYIESLVKTLHKQGYSINIDTCGDVPYENFERILPFVDTFLYDIKMIDSEKHKTFTGRKNDRILENIKRLYTDHTKINIRIPLIEGVNTDLDSISNMIIFIKQEVGIVPINLLPYHNIGEGKYQQLHREYPGKNYETPTEEQCMEIVKVFQDNGFCQVRIGG